MQGVPDPMFAESDKCELSPRRSNGDAANAPVKSFMIVASIVLVLLAFFNMHRADRLLARGWHFLVGFQDVDVSQWGNRVSYIDLEGEAWITPFFGGKFVPSEMEETKQPVFFAFAYPCDLSPTERTLLSGLKMEFHSEGKLKLTHDPRGLTINEWGRITIDEDATWSVSDSGTVMTSFQASTKQRTERFDWHFRFSNDLQFLVWVSPERCRGCGKTRSFAFLPFEALRQDSLLVTEGRSSQ